MKASITVLSAEVEQSVLTVHENRIFLISTFGSYYLTAVGVTWCPPTQQSIKFN